MSDTIHTSNEQLVADAFSRQSKIFDDTYSPNKIIQYKRERVRAHVNQLLHPNSHILELNAGTGEDTTYFAGQGHYVHATDIASGMLQQLTEKVQSKKLQEKVTIEQCSFTALDQLQNRGPFDLIFSNFAGLNCTNELDKVINSFVPLLKPGHFVTMVLLPPFCLWELALALKGNFKSAFRRINSKNGAPAHIEGVNFTCWYYHPKQVAHLAKNNFDIVSVEGLCTVVPPSYFEHFADNRPKTFNFLKKAEASMKHSWPWKNIGDYYIISLRKK